MRARVASRASLARTVERVAPRVRLIATPQGVTSVMSACEREGLLHDTGATSTTRSTWTTKRMRDVVAIGVGAALLGGVAVISSGERRSATPAAALGDASKIGRLAAPDLGVGMADVNNEVSDLGRKFAYKASPRLLPVFFHTEKSGGTSLVLHALELLAEDRPEVLSIVERVRTEDVMLDSDLRHLDALCPGSAMFLTTVWKSGSKWEPGKPRPLEDYSNEHLTKCSLLTSHTGRDLLKRAEDLERSNGLPTRPKFLMGMFRDPVEYQQASWRSELFMYHDLRAALGWGKLAQTPLGTALPDNELKDFSASSKFADIMLNQHCAKGLGTNFQTKKILEEQWSLLESNQELALKEAKKRVQALNWIGLTHKFDTSACMLAYGLRKKPKPTSDSNYDRAKLLPEVLAANHPHSGDANEGKIDESLKQKLYACNDMDTQIFHVAEEEFNRRVSNAKKELQHLVDTKGTLSPINIDGPQWLEPQEYLSCLQ